MSHVRVETELAASPDVVWADVRHIPSHVEWMHDAVDITFTGDQTEGTGTTFDCLTKVGPLKLIDRMQITSWVEAAEMGVRHDGLVTGEGVFTLTAVGTDKTAFVWEERLRFPWWMGGPIGGFVGSLILKQIWKRNLSLLRRRFER
jgi:hypothetical protein